MNAPQQQEEAQSFNDERASITSELHTIVDNLQPDAPPQIVSPRRPFWQRTGVWQVPLCLIALTIILMYNPRVDNCNGFKITYKQQVLCISNDADFFLFVEHFVCDFIEKDKSVIDSLVADEAASDKMRAYFDKHNFSIETQPIEAEVLRGMRGQYDSASFCKNFTKACWNAGIRLLNAGQTDSACYYFNKIGAWSWGDSVLTAADKSVISKNCYADFLQNQSTDKAVAQEEKQGTAKGLNAVNDRLKNINNVFQNRINQRENRINQKESGVNQKKNSRQLQTNDNILYQQKQPTEVPLKTYTYYTNGTSERDPSELVKLENLEEIIVNNNTNYGVSVEVFFLLADGNGRALWYITPRLVQVKRDKTISIKINKDSLSKYMSTNKQLYIEEDVSGKKILSWPPKKDSMKK